MVHRQLWPLQDLIRERLVNTISFYFSNIHDDVKKPQLWKVFGACGMVKDVFIPSKKNREGKRFGFVRFTDEGNGEDLLLKLEQIRMHSTKLKVNLSRFERDVGVSTQVDVEDSVLVQPAPATVVRLSLKAGVSYAGLVVNDQGAPRVVEEEVFCEIPIGRLEELTESVVRLLRPNICVQQVRE